jgi:phosphoribosylanthranilate isomerase
MLMKCKGSFDCEVASPGEATSSLRMTLVCLFAQSDSVFMTWIKICGMTNLEDAMIAVDAGADAVGFVFYEKSPRCVSVETAREICGQLPERVEKIGVFVTSDRRNPWDVSREAGLTGVQQYLSAEKREGPQLAKGTDMSLLPKDARMLIALPMAAVGSDENQIESLASGFRNWGKNLPQEASATLGTLKTIVLDSGSLQTPGGTGKTFGWSKAVPLAEAMRANHMNLVVAGGLTPGNVGDAIEILKPWGVDVVSGVEARPGKKDPEKVRAFVRAVREMDARIA